MRVYRWEDNSGFGPFNSMRIRQADRFSTWMYQDENHMPVPFMDNLPIPPGSKFTNWFEWKNAMERRPWDDFYKAIPEEDIQFGFKDLGQAGDYFGPRTTDMFKQNGLVLKEYIVPDDKVALGNSQVAYLRKYAQEVQHATA